MRNIIQRIGGGELLHLGFREALLKKLSPIPIDQLPESIIIDFSTDGGRLYRVGPLQFWQVQFRVFNVGDKKPMIGSVFVGKTKPKIPFELLYPFLVEVDEVMTEGITLHDRNSSLQIRCLIADSPARAFVLNHYGHNSAHPCSKCKVEGHRCTVEGFSRTMVFPTVENAMRTDEEYRLMLDEDHYSDESPLSPFLGLVSGVPWKWKTNEYLRC